MMRLRSGLMGALVTMLVACSDPSGPRIPNPELPNGDDEEEGSIKVQVVESHQIIIPRTGP